MQLLAPLIGGSATAAAGAAGGGISFGTILSAGAGIISAGAGIASGLARIAQGRAEAAHLNDQAAWEDFNARQELTRGRAEAVDSIKMANDAIAAAQVAGFASGLAGEGSVNRAKEAAMRDAEYQVSMSRSDAEIRAGARRGEASRLRADARAAKTAGVFGAVAEWGQTIGRFARTG
jgi:hypothetical protein